MSLILGAVVLQKPRKKAGTGSAVSDSESGSSDSDLDGVSSSDLDDLGEEDEDDDEEDDDDQSKESDESDSDKERQKKKAKVSLIVHVLSYYCFCSGSLNQLRALMSISEEFLKSRCQLFCQTEHVVNYLFHSQGTVKCIFKFKVDH